jgi:hypothetical protein
MHEMVMCCSSLRLCVGLVRVVDYTVTEDLWYTQFRKNQDRDSREDAPACFGRPLGHPQTQLNKCTVTAMMNALSVCLMKR